MNQLLKSLVFSVFVAVSGLTAASPVNVNTATQSGLESIKGIGPSKAKTIIAERLDGGHFQDANDLQKRVRGIGMKSVEKMVDNGLTIEAPSSFVNLTAGLIKRAPRLADVAHAVKAVRAILRIVRNQVAEIKPFYV